METTSVVVIVEITIVVVVVVVNCVHELLVLTGCRIQRSVVHVCIAADE